MLKWLTALGLPPAIGAIKKKCLLIPHSPAALEKFMQLVSAAAAA